MHGPCGPCIFRESGRSREPLGALRKLDERPEGINEERRRWATRQLQSAQQPTNCITEENYATIAGQCHVGLPIKMPPGEKSFGPFGIGKSCHSDVAAGRCEGDLSNLFTHVHRGASSNGRTTRRRSGSTVYGSTSSPAL